MSYSQNTNYYRPSLFRGFRFFPPVVKALLLINIGIFLFAGFFGLFRIGDYSFAYMIESTFALYPLFTDLPEMPPFHLWQLFTYMFMHAGFIHLLFNMFALWMFGMELENNWGSKKFLLFYLACGIGAGISNIFLGPLFGQGGPTVGASGAVYGILLAFGIIFPDRPIFLYFFIPIRAKYFVMIFMAIELYAGITGTQDGIAHFAHLGGAAVGCILIILDSKRYKLISFWEKFISIYQKPGRYTTATKKGSDTISDAKFFDIEENQDALQQQVDEILDKISKEGYQNLSEKEKQILFEASKKLK